MLSLFAFFKIGKSLQDLLEYIGSS